MEKLKKAELGVTKSGNTESKIENADADNEI